MKIKQKKQVGLDAPPKWTVSPVFMALWMFWKRICSFLKKGNVFEGSMFLLSQGWKQSFGGGHQFWLRGYIQRFSICGIFWANSERIHLTSSSGCLDFLCIYIHIQGMTLPRDYFTSHEISGSQLLNQSFAQMRLPWWTCNCWIWILRSAAVSSWLSSQSIKLWFQSFWKGLKQTTTVFSVIFPISSECKILAWRHMTSLVGGENLALHPVAKGSSNFEWVSTRGRASHIIFISIVTWSVMAVQLAQPSGNMWKQGYLGPRQLKPGFFYKLIMRP